MTTTRPLVPGAPARADVAHPRRGARSLASDRPATRLDAASVPGQGFGDLLLLGAMSCQAPMALLSVRTPGGNWSTLAYGAESKEGTTDAELFEMVLGSSGPFEVPDLTLVVPGSALAVPPHSMRWAYGVSLGSRSNAVVVVLDRWLRQASRRDHRALLAAARRLEAELAAMRNTAAASTKESKDVANPEADAGRSASTPEVTGRDSGETVVAPSLRSTNGLQLPGDQVPAAIGHPLLRSHEVARIFDVTERTVINWAGSGKLPSLRTIGGHLRFRREDVLDLLAQGSRTVR